MKALHDRRAELQLQLRLTPKSHHGPIKAAIKQIEAEIILRQDEPWPEDVERYRAEREHDGK